MRNIKLTIQYDGSGYHGWQRQKGQPSIQEALESALRTMTREETRVIGSGRTDAGVHALAQAANFRTNSAIPLDGFLKGLNSLLPEDIAILAVSEVPGAFHALRDSVCKIYDYHILSVPVRMPVWNTRAWIIRDELDLAAMKKALGFFQGTHDFSAFQASGGSAVTSVRTVYFCDITVREQGPFPSPGGTHYQFSVAADGFLRYMVRNIVGFLVDVGAGRRDPGETASVLLSGDRARAGRTAPPQGLYLREVFYDTAGIPFPVSP